MTIVAIQLVALPGVFLFWMWWLHAAGRRTGVRVALVCFGLSFAAGIWAASRPGSSAGLSLLLLPYAATLAGLLGLAFGYGWSSPKTVLRIAGRLCLTAAALLIGAQVYAAR